MVHAATPKVMTAEETSAMTRRCMESAKTVRITLTPLFVAKTKSGLMLVDDTRSAVKTRAMIVEGISASIITSSLSVTRNPTIPCSIFAARITSTPGQAANTLGAVPLKLTTLLVASVTRVSSLQSAENSLTILTTSSVAVVTDAPSTERSRASVAVSRATIHATTSAMRTKSTESAEETSTTSRNPSVVTMQLPLVVAMATMQAVAITVLTTYVSSSVSVARCTRNAVCPLTTLRGTYAVPSAWYPKSVEATRLAV